MQRRVNIIHVTVLDPDSGNYIGLLEFALINFDIKIANLLLNYGVTSYEPLLYIEKAINNDRTEEIDIDILGRLLDRGLDPNMVTRDGFSLMESIVSIGRLDIVNLFIARGDDVNTPISKEEGSLLHISIINGFNDITEELIRERVDINAIDSEGKSVLDTALEYNDKNIEFLIQNGAKTGEELLNL